MYAGSRIPIPAFIAAVVDHPRMREQIIEIFLQIPLGITPRVCGEQYLLKILQLDLRITPHGEQKTFRL